MEKIIRVKGLFEIHEGDYVDVIMPFVSVAVTLHVFFPHKSDKRESWDSGSTGQLGFWQYTGVSSGTFNTVCHSYPPPPITFSVFF